MVGDLYKKLRTKYLWLSIIIIGIAFTVGIFSFYEFHQRHRRKPLTHSNNNSLTSRIPNNYTCNENTFLGAIHKWRARRWHYSIAYLVKWVTRGRERPKISKNGWRHLWTAPNKYHHSVVSIRILFFLLLLVKGSNSATMDAPISYFTNPSYPETDWVPNYNTYTIKVRNTLHTYQIHLEYIYNVQL